MVGVRRVVFEVFDGAGLGGIEMSDKRFNLVSKVGGGFSLHDLQVFEVLLLDAF